VNQRGTAQGTTSIRPRDSGIAASISLELASLRVTIRAAARTERRTARR